MCKWVSRKQVSKRVEGNVNFPCHSKIDFVTFPESEMCCAQQKFTCIFVAELWLRITKCTREMESSVVFAVVGLAWATALLFLSGTSSHYGKAVHVTLQGISLDPMLALGICGNIQKTQGQTRNSSVHLVDFMFQVCFFHLYQPGPKHSHKEVSWSALHLNLRAKESNFVSAFGCLPELLSISGLFSLPAGQALTSPPTKKPRQIHVLLTHYPLCT